MKRQYFKLISFLSSIFGKELVQQSWMKQFIMIIIDSDTLYNTGYILVTILAYNSPFKNQPMYYGILLFDIVKRWKDLQNVLMVKKNIVSFKGVEEKNFEGIYLFK